MKIEQILGQINPKTTKSEVEKIKKVTLPKELQEWVEEYKKVEGERDDFVWKWVYGNSEMMILSSVKKEYRKSVREIRFLIVMFVVLVDDIADKHKNSKILKELLKVPFYKSCIKFNQLNEKEKRYVKFVIKVWSSIRNIHKKYPRYNEFKEIIEFDIKQLLNAMEYAYLVNKNNYLINDVEYNIYFSHNMQIVVDLMIDLCCSLKFDVKELREIRKVFLYAQRMARIGNWITTWEREIEEEDFTSGVFAYALKHKIIYVEDVRKANKTRLIEKIKKSNIEEEFLKEWEDNYCKIKRIGKDIKTIKINDILTSLEKLIFAHFTSRGYK